MKVQLNNILVKKIYNQQLNTAYKYNNLRPLEMDVVSFGHTKTDTTKNKNDLKKNVFTSPQNKQVCNDVHKYAEPAKCYLEEILNHYLLPISDLYPADSKPFRIITNIKSSKSIKQKIIIHSFT